MSKPAHTYSSRVDGELHVWEVHRLWDLAAGLPTEQVAVEVFEDLLDGATWFKEGDRPTIRRVLDHMRKVLNANLDFPIILRPDGQLVDGAHRVARAALEGRASVGAVRLPSMPPPDRIEPLSPD